MTKIFNSLVTRVQVQNTDAGKGTIGLIIGVICALIGIAIAADAFGVINLGD